MPKALKPQALNPIRLIDPLSLVGPIYYKGFNNYQYYSGGFLVIFVAEYTPQTLFELLGPLYYSTLMDPL